MKKIYSFAMLLLTSAFALTSCETDNDSNPVLIGGNEPLSIALNKPEFSNVTVDLANTETVQINWSQPALTNPAAPLAASGSLGLIYAVQVSKDGKFTKTFDEALAAVPVLEDGSYDGVPENYDYVTLATTYSNCVADLTAEELTDALNKLNLWASEAEMEATDAFIRVIATQTPTVGKSKILAISNVEKVTLIPAEWEDVLAVPAKESYLWIPGNGNGWNHGVCPVLVSEDGEVFSGYAYMNGEFKFTPVDNWSAEYNNGSFTTVSDNIDCGDGGGGNINFTGDAGMYYFTVDLTNKSINAVAVSWSVIGGFNSWGGDEVMTYDTDNHCLSVNVNFAEDTQWKFRRDADWAVSLGAKGDVEPSTDMDDIVANGKNFVGTAGEHIIQLFIERPAQDGLHAVIK